MSDFDAILAELDKLEQTILRAAAAGAQGGAERLEETAGDKAHEVIRGMSGATFASTVAYVATQADNGEDAVLAAATKADALLENFTGHDGQVQVETAETLPPDTIAVVLTVPTSYIEDLESSQQDFLLRSLTQEANAITTAIAAKIASALS